MRKHGLFKLIVGLICLVFAFNVMASTEEARRVAIDKGLAYLANKVQSQMENDSVFWTNSNGGNLAATAAVLLVFSALAEHPGRKMRLATLVSYFRQYAFIKTAFSQVTRITEHFCPRETRSHATRVGAYSSEIYATWAWKQDVPQKTLETQKETLRVAAMLHDIGKLVIPEEILHKTERLTAEEYEIMKEHTVLGAWFFLHAHSDFGKMAAQVTLNHHEWWDGTGYPGHVDPETGQVISEHEDKQGKPRGKQRQEIPLYGRVVAIADVYDALSSRRTYKSVWEEDDILRMIEKGAGTQFDPEIVDAFFASFDVIRTIAQYFSETALRKG